VFGNNLGFSDLLRLGSLGLLDVHLNLNFWKLISALVLCRCFFRIGGRSAMGNGSGSYTLSRLNGSVVPV